MMNEMSRSAGQASGEPELRDVIEDFVRRGYTRSFHAREGQLWCKGLDAAIHPADVVIEHVVRLEGSSDPDEEVAVFAIECLACGVKGTYTVPFGPLIGDDDVAVVPGLRTLSSRLPPPPA
jgi:hypothetical protein